MQNRTWLSTILIGFCLSQTNTGAAQLAGSELAPHLPHRYQLAAMSKDLTPDQKEFLRLRLKHQQLIEQSLLQQRQPEAGGTVPAEPLGTQDCTACQ